MIVLRDSYWTSNFHFSETVAFLADPRAESWMLVTRNTSFFILPQNGT